MVGGKRWSARGMVGRNGMGRVLHLLRGCRVNGHGKRNFFSIHAPRQHPQSVSTRKD